MTTNSINNTSSDLTATNVFTTNLSFDGGTTNISQYSLETFTPVLAFGGNSVGITYAIQEARSVIIGKLCYLNITISLTNKGSSTGVATITGGTHPANTNLIRQPITTLNTIVGGLGPVFQAVGTQPYELYYQQNNNILVALLDTDFSNSSQVWINTSFQII